MDVKDKKILAELSINSRIPLTQLAKKVGLSREVTNYRLKNLEKNTIKKYSSQTNIQALGFQRTGCYLNLQNYPLEQENKFIEFLINHNFISAISINIGKYDLIFDIFYKTNNQLQKIIMEIENVFQNKIKEFFIVSIPIKQKIFYNKIFEQKKKIKKQTKKTIKKIDELDLQLLKILNKNSRESLVNISKKVNLKANAIGYRIKNLEKNNIIKQSTIFMNFEELGFDIYNLQIKTNNIREHKKIISFLENNKSIFYYYQYLGNKEWDLDIGLTIKNKKELKQLIQKLKQNFGEIINFKEIYIIDKIYKEELPEGIFE